MFPVNLEEFWMQKEQDYWTATLGTEWIDL